MRAIWLACVCAGCELYFGPSNPDAIPQDTDVSVIVPDAAIDAATITPPDPPPTCSTTAIYLTSVTGDPRAPFVIASIKDALAFYHVPITTTAPTGNVFTIQLTPTGTDSFESACTPASSVIIYVADNRSLSTETIVAHAMRGLGVMDGLPLVIDAGDCLNQAQPVSGCVFGRATTIASDSCQRGFTSPFDEAQMLANDLGCP